MGILQVLLLLPDWLDPEFIITSMGNWALWGVALIIVTECAIFPVLPGDSLLFAVGMFTAMGTIAFGGLWPTLITVYVVLLVAAVAGNLACYWVGHLIGPPLFKERRGLMGRIFNPKYVDQTHVFFEKYAASALILARFVPLVRTFVTLISGIAKLNFKTFISYTGIGAVAWVLLVTTAGYFLGGVPWIKNNFELACVIIVVVSTLPMVWGWLKNRLQAAKTKANSGDDN